MGFWKELGVTALEKGKNPNFRNTIIKYFL